LSDDKKSKTETSVQSYILDALKDSDQNEDILDERGELQKEDSRSVISQVDESVVEDFGLGQDFDDNGVDDNEKVEYLEPEFSLIKEENENLEQISYQYLDQSESVNTSQQTILNNGKMLEDSGESGSIEKVWIEVTMAFY
jgi:hypothetical protein